MFLVCIFIDSSNLPQNGINYYDGLLSGLYNGLGNRLWWLLPPAGFMFVQAEAMIAVIKKSVVSWSYSQERVTK